MTDLLKEIIAVDKTARARLAAAEEDRAEAYATLSAKKEALSEEEKRQARKQAEEISLQNKKEGEMRLEALREKNKAVIEKMEQLYAEKKEEWISDITAAVLSQREE